MIRVKICGLTRVADVEAAALCGADAVGIVLEPTSSRFVPNDQELQDLLNVVPPFVTKVAVFGESMDLNRTKGFDAVQSLSNSEGRACLRIRAFHLSEDSLTTILKFQNADAILLDSYVPGKLGGTGERSDWTLARRVVEEQTLPIILAGGLTPTNVSEAIRLVRPYAVDVSTGVESSPGIKDAELVRRFILEAKAAF